MKVILIAILFLCSVVNVSATNGGNKPKTSLVSGIVVDEVTGEPLEGVKLIIGDSKYIVYTDNMGGFEFEKETTKEINLTVELISYEKLVIKGKSFAGVLSGEIVFSMSEVD